ncbi:ATP-binding protein, partial [Janibacter sp. RAF20_2_2]
ADDQGVEVVVRDNGVGMAPDRLVRAVEEGRLGASSSIRGRMLDLGGDASWRSPGTGGTTVTLTVPAHHVAGSTP